MDLKRAATQLIFGVLGGLAMAAAFAIAVFAFQQSLCNAFGC